MKRPHPQAWIEAAALVAFLVLAGVFVAQSRAQQLIPIEIEALAAGPSSEAWMGIYFEDQKVGYAVSSETPTVDGGLLLRNRSAFEIAAFGQLKQVVTVSQAVMDSTGTLKRFEFFMDSGEVSISGQGEVLPKEIRMKIAQSGEIQELSLPIDGPPQMSLSLGAWLSQHQDEIAVGKRFTLPYFDPITLSQQEMRMTVSGVELLPDGEEAYWVEREIGEMSSRVLLTPAGDLVREEGAMGLALVRQTAEEAQRMPQGAEPVNIIALSAVKLEGYLPQPRLVRVLELQILGVEPERVFDGGVQRVTGDHVRVEVPMAEELLGDLPVAEANTALAEFLQPTIFLPIEHRELKEKSAEVLEGQSNRRDAAEALVDWVHGYLIKAPTLSVPNALEVLRLGQGDCNEHTALYVALARAAGIPSRIAAGVVYSDAMGENGGFYYHAWPEVYLGEQHGWVPVDPTFGQFPADASHVKLVEGDLDKQVEIMGVMGRLGFKMVEWR